jgi:oligosaccharide reducing-end xylanase
MSYGMMICVQLDRKAEFDKLWRWAKDRMQQREGPNKGYFAWSVKPDGTPNDTGPAPDGEEYFALALFFASRRWGDGESPFDYGEEARYILREALHKPDAPGSGHNLWDRETKLIRFGPSSQITDPSYHLPHFYELFSLWADPEDRAFWKEAAGASREFLKRACNPATGLAPDYAGFGGYPIPTGGHDKFAEDAFRVAGNVGLTIYGSRPIPGKGSWRIGSRPSSPRKGSEGTTASTRSTALPSPARITRLPAS